MTTTDMNKEYCCPVHAAYSENSSKLRASPPIWGTPVGLLLSRQGGAVRPVSRRRQPAW